MSFLTTVTGLVIAWQLVFFLLKVIDFRYNGALRQYLEARSITVSPFSIGWDTNQFNDRLELYGRRYRNILQIWFSIGMAAGALCGIAGLVVLAQNLISLVSAFLSSPETMESQPSLITPLVPGVTIPISVTPYVVMAFVINLVLHEFGHAIAGACYGLRIDHVGAFSLLFLPGGAYVDLPALPQLNPSHRLRVIYAGVWHNIVIFILAYLLSIAVPTLVSPIYHPGYGVQVVSVSDSHPLSQSLHAHQHVITAVSDCPVTSIRDWRECYQALFIRPYDNTTRNLRPLPGQVAPPSGTGYCASQTLVESSEDDGCCLQNYLGPQQCFVTQRQHVTPGQEKELYSCLPPSRVAPPRTTRCDVDTECTGVELESCYLPFYADEGEFLITLDVAHTTADGAKQRLYFIGIPQYVWSAIALSDYTPKYSSFLISSMNWPVVLQRLLYYVAAVSSALALLNAVPAWRLDGEAATTAWLSIWFDHAVPKLQAGLLWGGSLLLGGNILLSCIWSLR